MATRPIIPAMPPMMPGAGLFQQPGLAMPGGPQLDLAGLSGWADSQIPLPAMPERSAIDKLTPGSDLHKEVLEKLDRYFLYGRNEMNKLGPRWNWNEKRIQAYVSQPDYAQLLRELENNKGLAPEPVKVIVPYTYATTHAACTFLASVLIGRRPIFPLMASRGTTADKARFMENALQSNIESSQGYEQLWQFLWDSLNYGFGAMRISWTEQWGKQLRIIGGDRQVVDGLKYAGNKLKAIDPYQLVPDPRVPLWELPRRGDFVFWLTPMSKLKLMDMERDGLLRHVKAACDKTSYDRGDGELGPVSDSQRRARIGNDGTWMPAPRDVSDFYNMREGVVRLSPKDWKLGDEDRSELWKFTWAGRKQIIQAEPLGLVHERLPVAVTEPTSFGHEFGSLALTDFIGVFQDIISWLVNSRMENVRSTINNQFIADPGRVEMQDFRTPAAGRVIRLKRAAIGTDVREAIQQLQVMDGTQGHMNDIQIMRLLADSTTGINDNMRGIQSQGGRRSATEARMSMQAGASRLSQMAVRISSQGFQEIAEQSLQNIQQLMPEELWVEMTGDDGMPISSLLTPDMLVGEFNFKVSDGSLPYDKMAMLEQWKELLFGVAQDPELRATFSVTQIFEFVAKLGGATNIDSFKVQQMLAPGGQPFAPGQPPAGAVPVGPALPAPPQQTQLPAPGAFRR